MGSINYKKLYSLQDKALGLLDNINIINKNFLNHFQKEFEVIIEEINSKKIHKCKQNLLKS